VLGQARYQHHHTVLLVFEILEPIERCHRFFNATLVGTVGVTLLSTRAPRNTEIPQETHLHILDDVCVTQSGEQGAFLLEPLQGVAVYEFPVLVTGKNLGPPQL
jgi:hypothetical protein